MAERDIRKALKKRIEKYGGEIRAVKWIGRRGAPDVLFFFPDGLPFEAHTEGWCRNGFIETKAPGGKPTDQQKREHKRLERGGFRVYVISTLEQLDVWLPLPLLFEK